MIRAVLSGPAHRVRRIGYLRRSRAVSDPADLGVLEAAARLRARELSAAELLAACLRRIEERNGGPPSFDGAPGAVNAWVRVYPELAAEQARAADERLDRGDAPLLCGIPLGLKDLYAVEGLPLTASSRVLSDHVADEDSVAWARLRERGMVLVGHTHTHEFAAGGTTDQVGNPWAPDRSAGGSSGGSAAALAARMVPAALGTDTLGSLRIPSALCGTSAIKATHGRVPIDGVIALAPSLDHAGPMARSIADCAALLHGLAAGGAQVTPLMPPPAPVKLPLQARPGPRPFEHLTIAVLERARLDPDVADGLGAARVACERLGARAVAVEPVADPGPRDMTAIFLTDMGAEHQAHAAKAELYRPSIRELAGAAVAATDAGRYLRAQAARARLTARWEEWFAANRIDLVLEPTVPIVAQPRGRGYDPGHLGGEGDPLIELTALWDLTGFPVAALPAGVGRRSGLPVGVSLIAPRGAEAPLVQAAIDLQELALAPPSP
jgi:aspartyl-tRNA(Asn)/glutamyl-tRNA(Gln) amidotransferase subunit A